MGGGPTQRLRRLASRLEQEGLDAALISDPRHVYYLTGLAANLSPWLKMTKHPRVGAFLYVEKEGSASCLIGATELAGLKAEKQGSEAAMPELATYVDYDLDLTIVAYPDLLEGRFRDWLGARARARRLGYEDWHLPGLFFSALRASDMTELRGISRLLLSLRASKDPDEVDCIRAATRRLERVYRMLRRRAREGRSELELYSLANGRCMLEEGAFSYVLGDFVSGERSEAISGLPSSRKLKRGDTLILDLQAMYGHYWSDLSRTFVIGGEPSGEQRRAYEAIIEALKRAERTLRPGVRGKEVYEAVNAALLERGYDGLPHHAGHGVGLEDQEPPFLIPGEEGKVQENSVVAVEVGIYRRGLGGIRLEQLYLVEKQGAKVLPELPLLA